jgi:hypothetical protein
MWINNEDGTFTAEQGDTLWGLQQDTGRDWTSSDYTGDPKKLQIGQRVSFAATNEKNGYKTIDSNKEASDHYFGGDGSPVNIGPNTIAALKSHPEQLRRQDRITSGATEGPYGGDYSVNMTLGKGTFYIGNTGVLYSATYGRKFAVIDFEGFANDGLWDIWAPKGVNGDGMGPQYELPYGKPCPIIPHRWTISVPNPRLK